MTERNAMATLTRWVLAHKKLVAGLWLVLALAGIAAMGPADRSFNNHFDIPGKEAFAANSQIAATYGNGGDAAPLVPVVSLPDGKTVDSPNVTDELDAALSKVESALPHARVESARLRSSAFQSPPGTGGSISLKTRSIIPLSRSSLFATWL